MGLIARELERRGIATVVVTHFADLTDELGVPRSVFMPGKLGGPIGMPGDIESQVRDLQSCLEAASGGNL